MRELEYRSLAFALKGTSADGGEFEGLASAFFVIDDSWFHDIVAPGAFAQDLPEFLERGFVGGMNHNWDEPIGRPLAAEETREGLAVRAAISDTGHGRDVRTLMRDGVVKRLSIGFRTLGRRFLETADEVRAWWREQGYVPTPEDLARSRFGARLLTRVKLFEFSPVAVPANWRAVITAVKGGEAEPPGGGLPLRRHAERVTAAVEELARRLGDLRELRGARGLSPEHAAGLRRLEARLRELRGGEQQEPGAPDGGAAALYEQFRKMCGEIETGRV